MNITTLWKVCVFSIGKEFYESILILAKLWLILSVIPLFHLEDIYSPEPNNTKYLITW